jgi:hypothetical protein
VKDEEQDKRIFTSNGTQGESGSIKNQRRRRHCIDILLKIALISEECLSLFDISTNSLLTRLEIRIQPSQLMDYESDSDERHPSLNYVCDNIR